MFSHNEAPIMVFLKDIFETYILKTTTNKNNQKSVDDKLKLKQTTQHTKSETFWLSKWK